MLRSTRPSLSSTYQASANCLTQAARLDLLQHGDERLLPGKPLAMCFRAVHADAGKVLQQHFLEGKMMQVRERRAC